MTPVFKLAASTALALLALPALAQDESYLGRIIVGYSADGTPVYAAENTSTLEGNAVTAQGGVNKVEQILQQTPGVTSLYQLGQPGLSVQVRGQQGAGRVETSVEGVPQNYRFKGHSNSDGFAYVDPAMISQIGVTRGAVTTAGGFGTAGSINFGLLSTEDVLNGKERGGLARFSYGTNGGERSAVVAAAQAVGAVDMMFALSDTDSDNYENGEGDEVGATWRDSGSKLFRVGYDFGEAGRLDFLASRYTPDYQYQYIMSGRVYSNYLREVNNEIYKLDYSYQSGNLIDLSASLYTTSTSAEDIDWYTITTSQTNNGRVLDTATTGFSVTNTSVFGDLASVNGFEWSEDTLSGEKGTAANPTDATASRYALFSENIFTQDAWEFTFGLRASGYEIDRGEIDEAISKSSIDPKVSVGYQLNDAMQVYGSLERNFRAPTVHELGGGASDHGSTDINYDLKPETAVTVEVGANLTFGALSGRVNAFRSEIEDYIVIKDPNTRDSKYINSAEAIETSGIEVELAYETQAYSAVVAYAYTTGTNDADEPLAPKNVLTATLASHHMDGALTLGGSVHYNSNGTSDLAFVTSGAKADPDAYTLLDLFATYEVSDALTLTGKIANLADAAYTPWSAQSDTGMGRSVYIGADYRF